MGSFIFSVAKIRRFSDTQKYFHKKNSFLIAFVQKVRSFVKSRYKKVLIAIRLRALNRVKRTTNLFPILFNKLNQAINSLLGGDIFLDALFALVERYLARTRSYIPIIGICHLSRAIYDATHDANLEG